MREPGPPAAAPSRKLATLLVSIVVCLGVQAVGGVLTASGVRDWYPTLRKPGWTPPDWVFFPVWTVLYAMIALSGWLVWRRAGWVMPAHGVYAAQLAPVHGAAG